MVAWIKLTLAVSRSGNLVSPAAVPLRFRSQRREREEAERTINFARKVMESVSLSFGRDISRAWFIGRRLRNWFQIVY